MASRVKNQMVVKMEQAESGVRVLLEGLPRVTRLMRRLFTEAPAAKHGELPEKVMKFSDMVEELVGLSTEITHEVEPQLLDILVPAGEWITSSDSGGQGEAGAGAEAGAEGEGEQEGGRPL